jgi:hypothetical protein
LIKGTAEPPALGVVNLMPLSASTVWQVTAQKFNEDGDATHITVTTLHHHCRPRRSARLRHKLLGEVVGVLELILGDQVGNLRAAPQSRA